MPFREQKKDHSCQNVNIDAGLYRRLMEVSKEAGQTRTMVVERAMQSRFQKANTANSAIIN